MATNPERRTLTAAPRTSSTYDVFGSNAPGVEGIIASIRAVQEALDVALTKRASSYSNGNYLTSRGTRHGEIRHLNNVSKDPEEVPYPEYGDYRIVVTVDYALEPDTTASLLVEEGFVHLRRRIRRSASARDDSGQLIPSESVPLPTPEVR
jgi:hypothetical protein